MKYVVMSNPLPSAPTAMRGRQSSWWDWVADLEAKGVIEGCYVKIGRGAILVMEVPDPETLHRLIAEWSDRVPAEYTVIPLADRAYQEGVARRG